MPAPKKPKKAFIQFAIALAVAVVVGIVGIGATIMVVMNVSGSATKAQQEIAEKEAELEQKLAEAEKKVAASKKTFYKVVQVMQDLEPGTPITSTMVIEVDQEEKPEIGVLTSSRLAVGKLVKEKIPAGEPLRITQLMDEQELLRVDEGMRVVTLKVDNASILADMLTPGARVDILTTLSIENKTISKTILQDVRVLASPQQDSKKIKVGGQGAEATPVMLAVTPKQAEMLMLAGSMGRFQLTLRNYNDKKVANLQGMDVTELLTGVRAESLEKKMPPPPEPVMSSGMVPVNYTPDGGALPDPFAAAPASEKFSMEIYQGSKSEKVEFER